MHGIKYSSQVLFSNKVSVSGFRHWKRSELWRQSTFRSKPICPFSFILLCVHPSLSVGRLAIAILATILHVWLTSSAAFYQVHSACDLSVLINNLSSLIESSPIYLPQNRLWDRNDRMNVLRCCADSAHSFYWKSG